MLGVVVHMVIAAAAVAAVLEFAPAIVHARSDVVRWRLVAAALVFAIAAAGLTAHRNDPLNWRVWGLFVADLAWLYGARLDRAERRRERLRGSRNERLP